MKTIKYLTLIILCLFLVGCRDENLQVKTQRIEIAQRIGIDTMIYIYNVEFENHKYIVGKDGNYIIHSESCSCKN